MKYFNEGNVVIKSWCNEPEQGALDQAINLSNLPFAFKQIALMPDTHQGYGMPIGGVLATKGVIIPNAVGVDIGCGMCAVKTDITEIDSEKLKQILGLIREHIPVGFNHHKKPQDGFVLPGEFGEIIERNESKIDYQLGTLGGGNHFIEIQKGNDGYIWLMVHSGSRNLGKQVADYYNKSAVSLNERWHTSVNQKWELAFLPIEDEAAKAYLRDMQICVDFALANRNHMIEKVKAIFYSCFADDGTTTTFDNIINIAHNYAKFEHHFGKNVIIHRKGATSAYEGEVGIIPGSQGTKSYIVKGKGNPESFMSCSHGAGRRMGRKQAQRELNLDSEIAKLESQGILHAIRGIKDLDEASGAYKDIDIVMKEQEDLIDIVVELMPLAVIKG